MVMDKKRTETPFTDEWWFKRLFGAFHQKERRRDGVIRSRVGWCDYLWNWYLGTPSLPQHAETWQAQVTLDVLNMGRANFAKLAVDSKLNRLKLETFRPIEVREDEVEDEDETPAQRSARKIMARHKAAFDKALLYASVMGTGYIWVGKPDADGIPTVTAEDPRECVTVNDPVDGNRVIAALKMYRDDVTGFDYAIVAIAEPYTPTPEEAGTDDPKPVGERVRVARRKSSGNSMTAKFMHEAWEWVDEKSGPLPIQGRGVMVHRIEAPEGLGDFEPHLDLLARINNMIVDRLWISKFQVFRQRVLMDKGDPDEVDPIVDDDDKDTEQTGDGEGQKTDDMADLLQADPGAVWRLPRGYEIWESTPTDLTPALNAVKDDIKEFAACTFTPLYVFTPDAVQGSAEGASLAREGQVFKAEAWQTVASRPFLAAAADMLAVAETPVDDLELKWMPAERYSLLQKAQAAQYAQAAGVPWEGRMEDYLQLSPDTIRRYKAMRRADALLNGGQLEAPGALPGTAPAPADQQGSAGDGYHAPAAPPPPKAAPVPAKSAA